jgi:Tfp pilus assembly protein PilF
MKFQLTVSIACALQLVACVAPANRSAQGPRIEPLLRTSNTTGSAAGLLELGKYYQGQNRLDQAIHAFQRALEIDRQYVEARSALGVTYSRRGEYLAAIHEFELALASKPGLAYLYNNLGYTHFLQKNHAAAASAYEKALQLEPGNPRTLNNLGAAYAELGWGEKARLSFEQARQAHNVALAARAPATRGSPPVRIETAGARGKQLSVTAGFVPLPVVELSKHGQRAATPALAETSAPELPAALVPVARESQERNNAGRARSVYRLEISNGNGTSHLAANVNKLLSAQGAPAARLSNARPFTQQETIIQYRAGFEQEALALSHRFPSGLAVQAMASLRKDPDVRLLLGRDATKADGWYALASRSLPVPQQRLQTKLQQVELHKGPVAGS